ncbi:HlyU family transcriptional regulator [Pseudoroseicyclus aestuarii]|uniref:Transcriptional activator HlyU n=1 Tax=Pseudoroseicyclus aestuarii TaxID=1795041 RepID=A0A318SZR1_9RHOB|nr:HlyU family transcriptional regulator [Pseudoroseicyclus aestuarii]PYE85916.1 hypothetical protein DFP88_101590 [Pseudoroseicyclus aestuarii]
MSLWSKLFGGGTAEPAPEPAKAEDYKGFSIRPEPIKDGGQHRVAARIEKTVGGTLRSHYLIRADTTGSADEAASISLAKARQVIDEQGEALFD